MNQTHIIEFHAKNYCRKAIRAGLDSFVANGLSYTEAKGMLTSIFRVELPSQEAADALEKWLYATARDAR